MMDSTWGGKRCKGPVIFSSISGRPSLLLAQDVHGVGPAHQALALREAVFDPMGSGVQGPHDLAEVREVFGDLRGEEVEWPLRGDALPGSGGCLERMDIILRAEKVLIAINGAYGVVVGWATAVH